MSWCEGARVKVARPLSRLTVDQAWRLSTSKHRRSSASRAVEGASTPSASAALRACAVASSCVRRRPSLCETSSPTSAASLSSPKRLGRGGRGQGWACEGGGAGRGGPARGKGLRAEVRASGWGGGGRPLDDVADLRELLESKEHRRGGEALVHVRQRGLAERGRAAHEVEVVVHQLQEQGRPWCSSSRCT